MVLCVALTDVPNVEHQNIAIFFIFSRAGCDKAAAMVARSFMGPRDPNLVSMGEFDEFDNSTANPKKRKKSRQRGRPRSTVQDDHGRDFRSRDFLSEDIFLSMMDEDDSQMAPSSEAGSPLSESRLQYYGKVGLLSYEQVLDVASKVAAFNRSNGEIAFNDDLIEQYLLGVGSHHAGMLPAHKSFVEVLFQHQLMKAVFATETLAAGINMPARSTAICALAKRGNKSSMELLETSNLLQMAGRAGRRGKDLDGTCVILATPFETHDDAAQILLGEIKPIASQFSPSYSLCVNLIARGAGTLDVARQLVSKSFAMWKRSQPSLSAVSNDADVLSKGDFLESLVPLLRVSEGDATSRFESGELRGLRALLEDRGGDLKRASKSLRGAKKTLELEEVTLSYLKTEYNEAKQSLLESSELSGDATDLLTQIKSQEKRVQNAANDLAHHPFSLISEIFNHAAKSETSVGRRLTTALTEARDGSDVDTGGELSPEEISSFAKAAVVTKRKGRKLSTTTEPETRDAWEDFVAMTKVLVEYGCLSLEGGDPSDSLRYEITEAGSHCGLLGFGNSLWVLVALGCVWGESDEVTPTSEESMGECSRTDADFILDILTSMTASQLAGYVACVIGENSRDTGPIVEQFQGLDLVQQQAVRKSVSLLDRFEGVQEECGVAQDFGGMMYVYATFGDNLSPYCSHLTGIFRRVPP